jgi:hypothetical protein
MRLANPTAVEEFDESRRRWLAAACLTTLAAALLTLHQLGAGACRSQPGERGAFAGVWCEFLSGGAVCRDGEANHALIMQQMIDHRVLLFPRMNGQVPMRKPPLYYWLAAALARIGERPVASVFDVRLVAALFGIAGVALVIAFGWSLLGPRAGVLAGLMLSGWHQYIARSRLGVVDSALIFFDTLALFSFVWWLKYEGARPGSREAAIRRGFHYLFAVALGLAVLSKGPIGLAIPGLALLVSIAIERRWNTLRALCAPGPLVVGIALAASWYLVCIWYGQWDLLREQLASENLNRLTGALGQGPPWYYLVRLPFISFPLAALAMIALICALQEPVNADRERSVERDAVRLFAAYFIVTIAVLSLTAYKEHNYLVPLWPPSAVMIAWWVERKLVPRFGEWPLRAALAISIALVAFNYFYNPYAEARVCEGRDFRRAAAEINRMVAPNEPLYSWGFSGGINGKLAPLLFYLRRNAPLVTGKLRDAPFGYVVAASERKSTVATLPPGFTQVGHATWGDGGVVVLYHDGGTAQ